MVFSGRDVPAGRPARRPARSQGRAVPGKPGSFPRIVRETERARRVSSEMGQDETKAVEATREASFLLAEPEKRLLRWIAARLPRWVLPDDMTALGVLAAFGAVSYTHLRA